MLDLRKYKFVIRNGKYFLIFLFSRVSKGKITGYYELDINLTFTIPVQVFFRHNRVVISLILVYRSFDIYFNVTLLSSFGTPTLYAMWGLPL